MYQHHELHDVREISRDTLVHTIFDHGLELERGYDTLVMAVLLADKSDTRYTAELAHVCLTVASKANEDYYDRIADAASVVNNGIVYVMERELLEKINYDIPRQNFITAWMQLFPKVELELGMIFGEIARQICLRPDLIHLHPMTLLMGVKLLHDHGKLRAISIHRKKRWIDLFEIIGYEYGISTSTLIQYI